MGQGSWQGSSHFFEHADADRRNLLSLQPVPNANSLKSNCCAFQSAPSLQTKLTQPRLTGWDLSRCCCGRIHEWRCRRSFQPGHLSWFLSWPGEISGTAGEGKDKLKRRRKHAGGNETRWRLYLQAHVIRNDVVILCMQNKKRTGHSL